MDGRFPSRRFTDLSLFWQKCTLSDQIHRADKLRAAAEVLQAKGTSLINDTGQRFPRYSLKINASRGCWSCYGASPSLRSTIAFLPFRAQECSPKSLMGMLKNQHRKCWTQRRTFWRDWSISGLWSVSYRWTVNRLAFQVPVLAYRDPN